MPGFKSAPKFNPFAMEQSPEYLAHHNIFNGSSAPPAHTAPSAPQSGPYDRLPLPSLADALRQVSVEDGGAVAPGKAEGAPQVSAPPPQLRTKEMDWHYRKHVEEARASETGPARDALGRELAPEGGQHMEGFSNNTAYLRDAEVSAYQVHFADGKMMWPTGGGQDGQQAKPVDTTGARSALTGPQDGHRAIFVMRPDGSMVVADAAELFGGVNANRTEDLLRVHHSSLSQGGEVAGAGEMVVGTGLDLSPKADESDEAFAARTQRARAQFPEGRPELLTDRSGHYRPESHMTAQVARELHRQGAPIEQMSLELMAKPADASRKVEQVRRGGALQLLGYDDRTANVQEQILYHQAIKDRAMRELLGHFAEQTGKPGLPALPTAPGKELLEELAPRLPPAPSTVARGPGADVAPEEYSNQNMSAMAPQPTASTGARGDAAPQDYNNENMLALASQPAESSDTNGDAAPQASHYDNMLALAPHITANDGANAQPVAPQANHYGYLSALASQGSANDNASAQPVAPQANHYGYLSALASQGSANNNANAQLVAPQGQAVRAQLQRALARRNLRGAAPVVQPAQPAPQVQAPRRGQPALAPSFQAQQGLSEQGMEFDMTTGTMRPVPRPQPQPAQQQPPQPKHKLLSRLFGGLF